jgi:hypothetical protein
MQYPARKHPGNACQAGLDPASSPLFGFRPPDMGTPVQMPWMKLFCEPYSPNEKLAPLMREIGINNGYEET